MIPVAVAYMRDPAYSDFIAGLANVSGLAAIIGQTMTILAIFMNDARFLALMSVAYILIIITYRLRAKSAAGIGLNRKNFGKFYAGGIALGIVMMSLVFALLFITGKVTVNGIGIPAESTLTFIFSLLMWNPAGCRGRGHVQRLHDTEDQEDLHAPRQHHRDHYLVASVLGIPLL